MVTRASVALQVLGLTPHGSEFYRINGFVLSVVGDVLVDNEALVVISSILRI